MVTLVSYLHVSRGCNGVTDGWFVPDSVLSTRTHNPRLSLRALDGCEGMRTHTFTHTDIWRGWGWARGVQPQRKQVDRHLLQHDTTKPTASCQGISFSLISLKHHLRAANTWTSTDQETTPFVFVYSVHFFVYSTGRRTKKEIFLTDVYPLTSWSLIDWLVTWRPSVFLYGNDQASTWSLMKNWQFITTPTYHVKIHGKEEGWNGATSHILFNTKYLKAAS